jgi:hypothetical protein
VIDLHGLRARVVQNDPVVLTSSEGKEILAELEASRMVVELPLDGVCTWPMTAQREMVMVLLLSLASHAAGETEARMVADVVVQELAGLARTQVRSG